MGIDTAFYIDDENAQSYERRLLLKQGLLKAYEPFKVAQRFLAILYGIPYVVAWFTLFAVSFVVDTSAQLDFLVNSEMAYANLIILAFYFAGGAGESVFKYRAVGKRQ